MNNWHRKTSMIKIYYFRIRIEELIRVSFPNDDHNSENK